MKKTNIIIIIVIVVFCLLGWFLFMTQKSSQSGAYSSYVEQADEWAEKGLYQRAISNYELALAENPSEELYIKELDAYKQRYEEAPEETEDDYMDFLEKAVETCPANKQLVDSLVDLYTIESNYEGICTCLEKALENGYESEELKKKLLDAKYAFKLRSSEFSALYQSVGDLYTVEGNQGWNLYELSSGYVFSEEYGYVGLCNEDEIVVITGEDSRLLTTDGMVMGIFDGLVSDAGIFSEGLIAACVDGEYSYYDEFAEKQFGSYEQAGTFQNDIAAVKTSGSWMFVEKDGNSNSEKFNEIVIDFAGRYLQDGLFLACADGGSYGIYDEDMNLKTELNCDDTDILTSDGIIAVCQNGKWGFQDTSGEVLIEAKYDEAKSFSNGLAAVCEDGLWGFIDKEDNLVIEYQFADAGYMSSDGICPVRIYDYKDSAETEDSKSQTKQDETEAADAADDPDSEEESEGSDSEVLETWKLLELELGIVED